MEESLFDEILQEIFTKLPSSPSSIPSFESIPLVSKRWLRLYRASKSKISLRINPFDFSLITLLPSILLHHPSLSSLSLLSNPNFTYDPSKKTLIEEIVIILCCYCSSNLRNLEFLIGPLSLSSLLSLSSSLSSLTSLSIHLSRPVSFTWIASFPSLNDLSIEIVSRTETSNFDFESRSNQFELGFDVESRSNLGFELGIKSISLSGIQSDDTGITWLWKRCRKLKSLNLKSCEAIGDIEIFGLCLVNLEEIELRTCRSIVDIVLLKLSENSESLTSLLLYDGGSKDGLIQFMNNSRSNSSLKHLDFRLPMDLIDDHLLSLATNFTGICTLKLTSCYFVTGYSLKGLASSFSSTLEELSLVSCDVVERESGVLATLGQDLGRLRKLELGFNEWLSDKEVVSMLVSCKGLMELNLRGCKSLTGAVLICLEKCCENLRNLDIVLCKKIGVCDLERFVGRSKKLKKIVVEDCLVNEKIVKMADMKFIEVVGVNGDSFGG